jgi:type I pantothenate kinase
VRIAPEEVEDIYLPLSHLVALLANARRDARRSVRAFLGRERGDGPFIIGIAGCVAVGKSTTAKVLQALLRATDPKPTVDLLPTDGFLYPNAILEARGLMGRKGFPESYDQPALVGALAAIRSGNPEVAAPVYSHVTYDIVPHEFQLLRHPDIVIVEGLNVLQVNPEGSNPYVVVSDFFDFSIYVDAPEDDIARWFRARTLALLSTARQNPDSFFRQFASFSDEELLRIAEQTWTQMNLVNFRENVAPTRGRADLVLEKDSEHRVERLILRRY